MKVHKFKFGTKELPVYFGIDAVEEVMRGQDPEKMGESLVPLMKRAFAAGLRHGCKKSGDTFTMTPPQITDLIDEHPRIFRKIFDLYSVEAKFFFDAVAEPDKKK